MLAKVAHEAGADFVTIKIMKRKKKRVYPIIPVGQLTDRQKGVKHKKIKERDMAIVFVMISNQNKYGRYKEDCNNNYNNQNDHRWPTSLSEAYDKLNNYKFNIEYYKTPNTQSPTSAETPEIQHSFLQESDTSGDEESLEGNNEYQSTQEHEEGTSHAQAGAEITQNTGTNSGGRNTITSYNYGREGHIARKCTHTTTIDDKLIGSRSYGSSDTGVTLMMDTMIGNWDEGIEDSEEYVWAFAQPSTKPLVTAIKASKSKNVKAKQTTTLNKVQGRLNPFWLLLDHQ